MLLLAAILTLMCAAASWAITQMVFAPRLATTRARNGVWAALFCLFFAIQQLWVMPVVQRAYEATLLDDALQESSVVWRTLKAYDPGTYNLLVANARARLAAGDSLAVAVAAMGAPMRAMAARRVGNTSDAAAVAYLRVLAQEIDHLQLRPDDACWQFLYPADTDPLDLSAALPAPLLEADMAAFAEVIRVAATAPQAVPSRAQFEAALRPVALRLGRSFMDDLDRSLQPQTTLAGRRHACTTTAALYTQIFTLPTAQAGTAVRYLLGNTH
ncbi:MAG: hypothetical protein V4505_22315 [Pseudomonadota bacterium]